MGAPHGVSHVCRCVRICKVYNRQCIPEALFVWAGNDLDWKETLLDRTPLDEIPAHTLAAFV